MNSHWNNNPILENTIDLTIALVKLTVLIMLVFMLFACGGGSKSVGQLPPSGTSETTASVNQPTTGQASADNLANAALPEPIDYSTPAARLGCSADNQAMQLSLLQLVNEARASQQLCGDTLFVAADPLTLNSALVATAQVHSDDMASVDFFSHEGSDGTQVWDRAEAQGYNYRRIAENIAAGQESTLEVHLGWLGSPSHCQNLMDPQVTHFGAACTANENAESKRYWTTVFGRLQ